MKKIIALALAAVMAVGTTSVAFAATKPIANPMFTETELTTYYVMNNKTGKLDTPLNVFGNSEFKKGTTLYIPLAYEAKTGEAAGTEVAQTAAIALVRDPMSAAEMKKYKVKADLLTGAKLVKKVTIEYVKHEGSTSGPTGDYYQYFAVVTTDPEETITLDDIAGKFVIYKSTPKSPTEVIETLGLEFGYKPASSPNPEEYTLFGELFVNYETYGYNALDINSDPEIDPNGNPVRKFPAGTEEITIEFKNVGMMEVNGENQDKLNLGFSTKYNEEIGNQFPVDLEFITFKANPKFYKSGVMRLYTPNKDAVLYRLENGDLVPVETTYDDEYEALKFGTKQLGTFVIAPRELTIDDITNVVPEDVKPIPDTGR